MGGGASEPRVRLAELVAALSLGVDLGFGQPMEHVLRQCLIALRLAGCAGLAEPDRAAVYYTALLVNIGCHSDAHEQAKWFGDDITLKSGKYAHEFGSVRGMLATMRLVGAGNPPLHRFRVGLEFALTGHRELDGMIAQHAKLARTLAEQLDLSAQVSEAIGAAYEQWDGRGWPGRLKADGGADRGADRPAFRVHRGGSSRRRDRRAPPPWPGGGPGGSSIRRWRRCCATGRWTYSAAWTRSRPGRP